MQKPTSILEQIFRAFLTALTVLSGALVGLAFHFTGPEQWGVSMFGGGVILFGIVEALQKTARIRGFGCLMGVTWLAVAIVCAAL